MLEELLGFGGILVIVIFLNLYNKMCEVGYGTVTCLHLLSKLFMQTTVVLFVF
jgi:hypothetical protein